MPRDERQKDKDWTVVDESGIVVHTELAVLMDIRDALKDLDHRLGCIQTDINWFQQRELNRG